MREVLEVPSDKQLIFERFSDSAASYVGLDSSDYQSYRTLRRAAKAKSKLRIQATTIGSSPDLPSSSQDTVIQPPPLVTPFVPSLSSEENKSEQGPSTSSQSVDMAPAETFKVLHNAQEVETKSLPFRPHCPPALEVHKLPKARPHPLPGDQPSATSDGINIQCHLSGKKIANLHEVSDSQNKDVKSKDAWSVFCNNCDRNMLNEHYHCNSCDGGDFDLCNCCVDKGVHCKNSDHWLIKRVLVNGEFINSTTHPVAPKLAPKPEADADSMPGSFTQDKNIPTRTCNCCVRG